ncbi:MAG: ABC-type nitrate/sulfonate/bicarbonate transport system periplasmic component [Candidatus Methanohalarchaeum thermophilum]|uniref:ABC-type nitrate/sulfonate/bicarbonate transport system periplasmic component n=1 Tax=Methanohalarchaeum thermophilum TaxID=1903181 RepID=A0A1Q6DWV8_METT1|nr:MAG: ABC-type nitrate/sulfonate/bicarbonate transport system periplasmic component [Candidatus Methanohalarchaeum thermophilum]
MVDSLSEGSISAFIGWEPYNAQAVVNNDAKILMNSSEIWNHHPCCVVAYDSNWYQEVGEEKADNILKRYLWAHVKATEWVHEAKSSNSDNHKRLIDISESYTKRSEDVVEFGLGNVDYDYKLDKEGVNTYISKLREYGLFQEGKWNQAGFESAEDYTDNLIQEKYLKWAIEHKNSSAEEIKELTGGSDYSIEVGILVEDLHEVAFMAARDLGLFEEVGLNVKIPDEAPYDNGANEMLSGFKENDIDIGNLGIAPASIHRINSNNFDTNDTKINVISAINYNGSAIVVNDEINSLRDLQGKTMAYPGEGTVQMFLTYMAAEKANISVR